MNYLDSAREMFHNDRFLMGIGAYIEDAGKDFAVCTLDIDERHSNAAGKVQGGVYYSLGDFSFAVAANSCGYVTVTLDASITYIRPVKGSKLIAKAKVSSKTRRICSCKVEIFDDLNTEVAAMLITGYITDTPNGLNVEADHA